MPCLKRNSGLFIVVWLLTGCGGHFFSSAVPDAMVQTRLQEKMEKPAQSGRPETANLVVAPESGGNIPARVSVRKAEEMDGCERELKALRRLDARRYAMRKAQFDRLMSGAAVYADLRTEVGGGTRTAVDAMYRFRSIKLCTEISQDVLNALSRQEADGASDRRN